MSKWVYSFGAGHNEGGADMKNLLGGKGANLAEMASIGLPVPPGFTLTTEVCTAFYDQQAAIPGRAWKHEVRTALAQIEKAVGRKFGDPKNPLLVSVRSGARVSDAGHDGHGAEPRPERRHRRGPGRRRPRCALRLGLLSPVRPDVRLGRCWASTTTGSRRSSKTPRLDAGVDRGYRADARTTGSAWWTTTRKWWRRTPASRSRRTRTNSCGAPSARCSARG